MVDTKNISKSICLIGKLLFDRGLTDSSGGNISVRDKDKIYITPKSSGFDFQWSIEEDQIIVTDLCKMPIIGDPDNVSREAATHYYIYQSFPDVNAIIHAHPVFFNTFNSAHMELPMVNEGSRLILGDQPITNIEESMPCSVEQAENIILNFEQRRKMSPNAALICGIPFHGSFAAGPDINHAFVYTESAEVCAKTIIYRKVMFEGNPKADFNIHKKFTKEDIESIEKPKEVCKPGFQYKDSSGNIVTYNNKQSIDSKQVNIAPNIIDTITKEIIDNIKKLK